MHFQHVAFLLLLAFYVQGGDRLEQTTEVDAQVAKTKLKFSIQDANGVTLIHPSDIKTYEWGTHKIQLRKGLRDELLSKLRGSLIGGAPFSVVVNDRSVYKGNFTTSLSSISLNTYVINLFPLSRSPLKDDQIQISFGYPASTFVPTLSHIDDLRDSRMIKNTLESMGKLAEYPAIDSALESLGK